MLTATVSAPAKINLCLYVRQKRADGYHEIDSVFLPLDLADKVRLEVWPDQQGLACHCPQHPDLDGPANLAAQAALRYLEQAGRSARVALTIHKRIWVGAGLGGGSSDAAATVNALDRLLGWLPKDRLPALAVSLGADVPFFLEAQPARAQGVGEHLVPLALRDPLPVLLVNPGFPLNTGQVYQKLGLVPGALHSPAAVLPQGPLTPIRARELVHNDLEPAATALRPEIATVKKDLLAAGAWAAALSGSGSTVFGLFPDRGSQRQAAQALSKSSSYQVVQATAGPVEASANASATASRTGI